MQWITNIQDPSIKKIYALSDIHADIHMLIIILRDCAKVIRKKNTSHYNTNELDEDMERLLNLNLNIENERILYVNDLNYEWCGGENTHVVICGDMIDGSRPNISEIDIVTGEKYERISPLRNCNLPNNQCELNEYWQIEIKIIRFINAINNQACRFTHNQYNRIHKLLGNHEIENINGLYKFIDKYAHKETLKLPNYLDGFTRKRYFNYGNPGYDELLENGIGIFLMINNNIFVHGQLDHHLYYSQYVEINSAINKGNTLTNLGSTKRLQDTVWGRLYDKKESNRNDVAQQIITCISIKEYLDNKLLPDIPQNRYTSDDIRIIVGHCPQSNYSNTTYINSTFSNITKNGKRHIISGLVANTHGNNTHDVVFGIGMECNKNTYDADLTSDIDLTFDSNERYIYKIDVGASRAFDKEIINSRDEIDNATVFPINGNNNILKLSPQTLLIEKSIYSTKKDTLSIIRSSSRNTRIHQPRIYYEDLVNNYRQFNDLRLSNSLYDPYITDYKPTGKMPDKNILRESLFLNKYKKYKNKYILLKNKILN